MFRVILMCLLTCCSSFMPLKQSESIIFEDHTQVVETKTRENYVRTSSGYYEYGLTDLFSYDFLVGLIDYYVNDLGVTEASYNNNDSLSNYVIQTSDIYSVYFYDHDNKIYEPIFNVTNIVLSKIVFDQTDSFPYFAYDFNFSNSSPYDRQFQIEFFAQRTNDNRLTIWGCDVDMSNVLKSLHSFNLWYAYFMLSEKISDYQSFIGNIFQTLRSEPQQIAYNQGYNDGFTVGYDSGETNGYEDGYTAGESAGYQTGFQAGVDDTIAGGTEAMTIFSGIMDVAFIPVNVFFLMFNYEVFGINIAGFVSGLLTIAIVIIIFKFILGRKL